MLEFIRLIENWFPPFKKGGWGDFAVVNEWQRPNGPSLRSPPWSILGAPATALAGGSADASRGPKNPCLTLRGDDVNILPYREQFEMLTCHPRRKDVP